MKTNYDSSKFYGRMKELHFLRECFSNESQAIVQITGPFGSGKTALMLKFVDDAGAWFSGDVRFGRLEEMDSRILEVLPTPTPGERMLWCFDGADFVRNRHLATLKAALKARPNVSVLINCRSPLLSLESRVLELEPMSNEGAENFLKTLGSNAKETAALYELIQANPTVFGDLSDDGLVSWKKLVSCSTPFAEPGIVGPDGKAISQLDDPNNPIRIALVDTNAELLCALKKKPTLVYDLPDRKFEEIVAEILRRKGFETQLTPPTRDGGFDIYAAKNESIGRFLYLVECKKWTPPNKVGIRVITSLHGVVQRLRATAGIVVTTSLFTADATRFQKDIEFLMQLRDYGHFRSWLEEL